MAAGETLEPGYSFLCWMDADHRPRHVRSDQIDAWETWFKVMENRRVEETTLGNYWISTVFVPWAFDTGEWFETGVYKTGTESIIYQEKYTTWENAKAGHSYVVQCLLTGELP